MSNSIEITNLCKNYSDFKLENVSFSVQAGSIMGFIGENGAGKSTTINAILNLIRKDDGSIKVLGYDSVNDDFEIRKHIGVVFDESFFHPNLTIKDINLFMSKIYTNWNSEIFLDYIKKFSLPDKKIVKEFSKGMRAKLGISVALARSPKVLILDEATSGLDPIVRDEVLDIFFEYVQNKENSILMSSHITSDLDKVADSITFIHKGKIIFSDKKDSLIKTNALLKCNQDDYDKIDKSFVSKVRKEPYNIEVLIKNRSVFAEKYPDTKIEDVTIENLMLFNIKGENV